MVLGSRLKALLATVIAGMSCHAAEMKSTPAANTTTIATTANGSAPTFESRTAESDAATDADRLFKESVAVEAPGLSHRIETTFVQLVSTATACYLDHWAANSDGGPRRRLTLGVVPPCHVLMWNDTPPRTSVSKGTSEGAPVGQKGDVRAWQYPSMRRTTVFIVIGDPVSEEEWAMRPKLRGLRCAKRSQAILLQAGDVALSKNIETGFACVESGADEKVFWMFAHDNL